MSPPAPTYRGKAYTVEDLARTLIVASVVHQGEEPFNLPLTPASARCLGRALEFAVKVEAEHDAAMAEVAAKRELSEAQLGEARVALARAETVLAEARRTNVRSLGLLITSAVLALSGGLLWGLA